MNKNQKIFHTILLSSMLTGFFSSAYAAELSSAVVDGPIKEFMQQHHVPGMAVAVFDTRAGQEYYFGVSDLIKKKPVTGDTRFEIGSITKVMTAILVAEDVQNGRWRLNQKITDYLTNPSLANTALGQVTLLDLTTHTSGLPFNFYDDSKQEVSTQEQFDTALSEWKPEHPIGKISWYSNAGIGLLGMALENLHQSSYADILQQNLFEPLDMTNSGLRTNGRNATFAQGYDEKGVKVKPAHEDLLASAYAVTSTALDMQKFLQAALLKPISRFQLRQAIKLTEIPRIQLANKQQGMAWEITPLTSLNQKAIEDPANILTMGPQQMKTLPLSSQQYSEDMLIEKTGGTDGFRSYIGFVPKLQRGVVILANQFVPDAAIIKAGRRIIFFDQLKHV